MELIQERDAMQVIREKYAEQFALGDRVWALISPLISAGQSLKDKSNFWTRWVTLALFTRQMRSFRSIVLLLERGLVPEAQKILRPMLETHLHFKFLASAADSKETARRYLIWEYANDQKLFKALNPGKDARYQELDKKFEGLFAEEKERLGNDRWKLFVRCGPPMLSMEALAKQQNLSGWYDTVYRATSSNIHAFNFLTYVKPISDDLSFNVNMAPIENGLDMTIEAAMALALEAGVQLNRVLDFGKDEEIRSLDADISKALQRRLANHALEAPSADQPGEGKG